MMKPEEIVTQRTKLRAHIQEDIEQLGEHEKRFKRSRRLFLFAWPIALVVLAFTLYRSFVAPDGAAPSTTGEMLVVIVYLFLIQKDMNGTQEIMRLSKSLATVALGQIDAVDSLIAQSVVILAVKEKVEDVMGITIDT